MQRPYVFGIGQHKTGTRSLCEALGILGWHPLHDATRTKRIVDANVHAHRRLLFSLDRDCDAFADNPIPWHVARLDADYPDSRFIYTTRPYDDWIRSRYEHRGPTLHWTMHKSRLRDKWECHDAFVREYFRDRPRDWLELRICDGEGWDKLCAFLGTELPDRPFPHENRRPFQFTKDSFSRWIPDWQRQLSGLAGRAGLRVTEIGSHEGRCAIWMLFNLCTAPDAELTSIDVWKSKDVERRFDANVRATGQARKVKKLKGRSDLMLPTIPLESLDLLYVDGSHEGVNVLEDAVLGFRRLKVGGILVFDDYRWTGRHTILSGPAIDAFLHIYGPSLKVLHHAYQVFVQRTS